MIPSVRKRIGIVEAYVAIQEKHSTRSPTRIAAAGAPARYCHSEAVRLRKIRIIHAVSA